MGARPVFCKSLAPMQRSRARRVTIALFVSGRFALLIYRKHTMLQADRGVTTVHATGSRTGCTA